MDKKVNTQSSTAWYDSPLYYDKIYQDYTHRETRFLGAVVKQYGRGFSQRWKVLEPACGSGRLLESLALRGHVVHGFDLNRHQVQYAKQRLKKLNIGSKVWRDSLQRFKAPRGISYDLVHCLVSTFKYLLNDREALSALRRVSAVLRSGGIFVMGLHLTNYHKNAPDYEKWISNSKGLKIISETWSAPARRKQRRESMRTRMTIVESGKTRVEETRWDFRTYSAVELKALLSKVKSLELMGCHDFRYQIKNKRRLNDAYADIILVLRKK